MVVEYLYNAWGQEVGRGGAMWQTLGERNPFRYRGYYYDQESGLYYLNSRYYDPETCRFINADGVMGINSNSTAYNLYAYCGNNPINRYDNNGMFFIDFILHAANFLALAVGIDTAAMSGNVLDMKKDSSGVYHANIDCWQQHFGYNKLYDILFDIGTSMHAEEFPFSYNGKNYKLWAWKGDYITLGAGAELGIYCGGDPHWFVDKSLAMEMSLWLDYNGENIITYHPIEYQWWITGFNPNYQNVNAEDLTAEFCIVFNDQVMYKEFRRKYFWDSRCRFPSQKYPIVTIIF